MARVLAKTHAVVLRTRRMGETSKLVTLFSEDHGKLKVTAKGARRPKSQFGGCLEVTWEVQIVCAVRDDRDLHTLSDAEAVRPRALLLGDLARLSYAAAACEMVDRLTIEHEPNRRLYRCLTGVLGALEEVAPAQLESLFWYYQLRVAEALGYRPELARCAGCGAPPAAAAWFSPGMGGAVCRDCSRGDGAAQGQGSAEQSRPPFAASVRRVDGDSLRLLAALQGLPAYSREAIPPEPAARRGEIRGLLRAFLEYHAGTTGRLRSLEFLDNLGAATTAVAT